MPILDIFFVVSQKKLFSKQSVFKWFGRAWYSCDVATLTHWGQVTHICVTKLTIIGSDNGLSPGQRQAITWTNTVLLSIVPLGTNFSEIWIRILSLSRKCIWKCHLPEWRPFCPGVNELTPMCYIAGGQFGPCFTCPPVLCRSLYWSGWELTAGISLPVTFGVRDYLDHDEYVPWGAFLHCCLAWKQNLSCLFGDVLKISVLGMNVRIMWLENGCRSIGASVIDQLVIDWCLFLGCVLTISERPMTVFRPISYC